MTLLLIVLVVLACVCALLLLERHLRIQRRQEQAEELSAPPAQTTEPDGECCGAHLVCERETLLQTNAEIVYFDDEELDALSGIAADELTTKQADQIREVFHTMKEKDVPGWVRSMQLRNINLPEDVREEALLIVRERRNK